MFLREVTERTKLIGGTGTDILKGQTGNDIFRFLSILGNRSLARNATPLPTSSVEAIWSIYARLTPARTSQETSLSTTSEKRTFSGKSGELRFKNERLKADTDGDARTDFEVAILDVPRMSEAGLPALRL